MSRQYVEKFFIIMVILIFGFSLLLTACKKVETASDDNQISGTPEKETSEKKSRDDKRTYEKYGCDEEQEYVYNMANTNLYHNSLDTVVSHLEKAGFHVEAETTNAHIQVLIN